MIHLSTTNLSAIKMYHLYKEMGVKNCTFFLELKDPSLENVNPFDENLDQLTMAKIITEVSSNPWYYLREICRIPEAGSVPFEFNRGNIAIVWCILNDISFFTIMPRQTGKTYALASIYAYLFYWRTHKSSFMLFGTSDKLVKNNLERVKKIRDEWPEFMKKVHQGKDNQHELTYDVLENNIQIRAPGTSKEGAMKVGRGFSTSIQWYDEFAFIPWVKDQYQAALYAYSTVSQVAKKNNLPYHRAFTTTAGLLNSEDGRWAFNFMNSCAEFSETMYDMDINQAKESIHTSSTNGVLKIEFKYTDLGKDDGYFDRMVKDANGDWDSINREVLGLWLDASTDHPLGQDLVIALNTKIKQPVKTIVVDDVYLLKIYRDLSNLDWDRTYLAGIDCGGNVLQDSSTFIVLDPTNREVVATLRSNSFSTTRFAKCIATIMTHIFPNLYALIERNSMGIAIFDSIMEINFMLKSRFYHDESGKPGIHNDKNIRPILFNDILKTAVIDDIDRIHDKTIISEITGLVATRTGRIDHPLGGHDDCLMGYLLARWFMLRGYKRERYFPVIIVGSREEAADYTDIDLERKMSKTNVKSFFRGASPKEEYSLDGAFAFMREEGALDEKGNIRTFGNANQESIMNSLSKLKGAARTDSVVDVVDGDFDVDSHNLREEDVKKTIMENKTAISTRQDEKPAVTREEQMILLKRMLRNM